MCAEIERYRQEIETNHRAKPLSVNNWLNNVMRALRLPVRMEKDRNSSKKLWSPNNATDCAYELEDSSTNATPVADGEAGVGSP